MGNRAFSAGSLLRVYKAIPTIPRSPNKINIIFDKFSIVDVEVLELSHFPKKMAIELLATIPQIHPQIRGILNKGYSTPRPIDAKKVLSPSSPIAIVEATTKMQFLVNELKNLIIRDLESVSVLSTETDFFDFRNPVIPKIKKVQYVKIFK